MLKAILFDFDGVLADTEPIHFMMFQQVLAETGLSLSKGEYYDRYVGFNDKECFQVILSAHGRSAPSETIQRLIDRKAVLLLDHLKSNLIIFPGVLDFVTDAAKHYRLAIVSGALRHEIDYVLEAAGMRNAFEHITAAQDVRHGKPDPEGYLHALRGLDRRSPLHRSECLVIEDTVAGIQAAQTAGMRCLAVANTYPESELAMADAVTSTLKGYDLQSLARTLWN